MKTGTATRQEPVGKYTATAYGRATRTAGAARPRRPLSSPSTRAIRAVGANRPRRVSETRLVGLPPRYGR
ncbi:hypothetical protein [Haladaptatus sp. NG-SE-30]